MDSLFFDEKKKQKKKPEWNKKERTLKMISDPNLECVVCKVSQVRIFSFYLIWHRYHICNVYMTSWRHRSVYTSYGVHCTWYMAIYVCMGAWTSICDRTFKDLCSSMNTIGAIKKNVIICFSPLELQYISICKSFSMFHVIQNR